MNVLSNYTSNKNLTSIRTSNKNWYSPMPPMIPLSYNLYCMNSSPNSIYLTKISPIICHGIYFNKIINNVNMFPSYIKCSNRRFNRIKSNPLTNYYSLLLYYPYRLNNSTNLQEYTSINYYVLYYIFTTNQPNFLHFI